MNDLTIFEPGGALAVYDPTQAKETIAKIDALKNYAIDVKNQTLIEGAAKAKAEEIDKLVSYYDRHIQTKGAGRAKSEYVQQRREKVKQMIAENPDDTAYMVAKKSGFGRGSNAIAYKEKKGVPAISDTRETLAREELENILGFSNQNISRWRSAIKKGEFETVLRDMWLRAARIIPPEPKEPDTSLCWTDPERFADYVINGLEKYYPRELIPAARDCAIERLQGYDVEIYEDEEEEEDEHEAAQAALEWLAPTDE